MKNERDCVTCIILVINDEIQGVNYSSGGFPINDCYYRPTLYITAQPNSVS